MLALHVLSNAEFDGFIKLLLRSYSGLFTGYAKIDEAFLARRSGLPEKRIYEFLKALSSRHIIHYIPRKDVPVVTFLEERLDEKNLLISPERYHLRKERYEKRIKEMIRYATSENLCRNQFLLGYFGQLKSPRCGRCDVCIEKKRISPGSPEHHSIQAGIEKMLAKGSQDLETLVASMEMEPELVIGVVELMLEAGLLIRGKGRLQQE